MSNSTSPATVPVGYCTVIGEVVVAVATGPIAANTKRGPIVAAVWALAGFDQV
jgi:hypothetical protein